MQYAVNSNEFSAPAAQKVA